MPHQTKRLMNSSQQGQQAFFHLVAFWLQLPGPGRGEQAEMMALSSKKVGLSTSAGVLDFFSLGSSY